MMAKNLAQQPVRARTSATPQSRPGSALEATPADDDRVPWWKLVAIFVAMYGVLIGGMACAAGRAIAYTPPGIAAGV
jgi:hypothetical protein